MTTTPVPSTTDDTLAAIEGSNTLVRDPDAWAAIHVGKVYALYPYKPIAPGDLGWGYYEDRGFSAPQPLYFGFPTMSKRAALGFLERERQISMEGWTPEHDDLYTDGQLLKAAACYLLKAAGLASLRFMPWWPFTKSWFKGDDNERNLQKAFALLLAEMDRRDRLETPR